MIIEENFGLDFDTNEVFEKNETSENIFIPEDNNYVPPVEKIEDKKSDDEKNKNGENADSSDDFKFDDNLDDFKKPEDENQKIIAELEAKGFKVEKTQTDPFEEEVKGKMNLLTNSINKAKEYIALSDIEVIHWNEHQKIIDKYKNNGQQVDKETIELELEAEMERYKNDKTFASLYAENLRNKITTGLIADREKQLSDLKTQVDAKINEKVSQQREKYQEVLKEIRKNGIFGQKFTDEEIQLYYKEIISGGLTSSLKNDPSLVVEFAIYKNNREKFKTIDGKSFGEGVKKAAEHMQLDDKKNSFFGTDLNKSQDDKGNNLNPWTSVIPDDDEKLKGKFVI